MRMKKIAIVENLIANRPSGTSIGSLPHSNGSALTARVPARRDEVTGCRGARPPPRPRTANTIRIGTM